MDSSTAKPKISPARNALSILLFVVAGVLLVIAAYLYIQDRRENDSPPPPPNVPGKAELANVRDILDAAGLDVEYGRESARVEDLSPVGQQLIVDGQSLYVFIYADPESRKAETETLDQDDLELVDAFGDPVTDEPLTLSEGSNVATILAGGDDALRASVSDAISSIP